jgi:hypothetical protein
LDVKNLIFKQIFHLTLIVFSKKNYFYDLISNQKILFMINYYSKFNFFLITFLCSGTLYLQAQDYDIIPIQSGFNGDVIINGVGSPSSSVNSHLDASGYALLSIDYKEFSGSAALSYGLPADGRITTEVARTPGLEFQMADYSQNNVLRLSSANQEGTLTFQNSFKTESLYMLATAGNGPAIVDVKVNFGDGSSQTFASVSISDWFGGTDYAIKGWQI